MIPRLLALSDPGVDDVAAIAQRNGDALGRNFITVTPNPHAEHHGPSDIT